jgi:cell division GTPase FtsZ
MRGVTDLMVKPGLINFDFADTRGDDRDKAMAPARLKGRTGRSGLWKRRLPNPALTMCRDGRARRLINITGGLE